MDPISQVVAENLRKLRQERKLSLQDLSEISGVSKSMLGEIERGSSNPTINIIWKIANGLRIPFTTLTTAARPPVQLVRATEHQGYLQGKHFEITTVFKYNPDTHSEIYHKHFMPGALLNSDGHPGVYEYLLITTGSMVLETSGTHYELKPGDSILFEASQAHQYANRSKEPCTAYMILHYDA